MVLVILGVVLLAAKWAAWGPFAQLSWWWVAAPFIGAVLWWQFSDTVGLTQKRAMKRMEDRKQERRARAASALGLDVERDRRAHAARAELARRNAANKGALSGDPTQQSDRQTGNAAGRGSKDPTL